MLSGVVLKTTARTTSGVHARYNLFQGTTQARYLVHKQFALRGFLVCPSTLLRIGIGSTTVFTRLLPVKTCFTQHAS